MGSVHVMDDVRTAPLSAAAKKMLRVSLGEQREHADAQIATLTDSFNSIVEAAELVGTDDEHDPEGTTIAFERAQVTALLNQASADRDAIDAAVAKLDEGLYGTCEVCERAIGVERLKAIPSASRCIACA